MAHTVKRSTAGIIKQKGIPPPKETDIGAASLPFHGDGDLTPTINSGGTAAASATSGSALTPTSNCGAFTPISFAVSANRTSIGDKYPDEPSAIPSMFMTIK